MGIIGNWQYWQWRICPDPLHVCGHRHRVITRLFENAISRAEKIATGSGGDGRATLLSSDASAVSQCAASKRKFHAANTLH